jgi:hypothetical protein
MQDVGDMMPMTDTAAPFFEIELKSKKKLTFDTIDQLGTWLEKEWTAWSWLQKVDQNIGPTVVALGQRIRNSNSLRNQVKQWQQPENVSVEQKEKFRAAFASHFGSADTIFSDDPIAIICGDIAHRISSKAGAGALATFLNINCNVDLEVLRGSLEFLLYRDGIKPNSPELVQQTISSLVSTANEDAQKRRATLAELTAETREFLSACGAEQTKSATEFEGRTTTSMGILKRDVDKAVASIKETEAAYRDQMTLQAPVEYWQTKAASHSKDVEGSRSRLINFTIFGTAGLIILLITLAFFASWTAPDKSTDSIAIYLKFAAAGAVAITIAFWIARVLLRIYLSDRHLLTDAEERVAMIKTYLALNIAGRVESADRALVLAPIFRSAADGIVKEEGPDASFAGVIARALDIKGRGP